MLKLLAQAERGGRATLPINERAARDYFAVCDLAGRDAIHAALANAEAAGCIGLEWGRGAAAQDLLRLRLCDADRLADWLGVPRARESVTRISGALGPLLAEAPAWLRDAYGMAVAKWCLGQSAFRIEAADRDGALALFKTALAVAEERHLGLDLRRFSARLLGDSKAVERLSGRLAELLRHNPQWQDLTENRDLFRVIGLEKFPPPLLIKGPLALRIEERRLDITGLTPYVGLSPDAIQSLEPAGAVPYLLCIENLASFQHHAREIQDRALLLYTAGFPGPDLIRVIQLLDCTLPAHCPFLHWGDRDIGGLRIFAQLSAALRAHVLQPHLMDEPMDGGEEFNATERRALETLAARPDPAGNLARRWLDAGLGPLEQEQLDPVAPR
nr:Wadjet anti-phage system protein JetD domain-containing protein [Thiocystis violacea]